MGELSPLGEAKMGEFHGDLTEDYGIGYDWFASTSSFFGTNLAVQKSAGTAPPFLSFLIVGGFHQSG